MYVVLKRRHLFLAGALALVLAAIPIAKRVAQPAVPAGASVSEDWGLHFEKDGEPPVGNASAKDLLQYGAYYLGDPSEKKIYLTHTVMWQRSCCDVVMTSKSIRWF